MLLYGFGVAADNCWTASFDELIEGTFTVTGAMFVGFLSSGFLS